MYSSLRTGMTVIIPFGVIMGLAWQGLRDQSPKHACSNYSFQFSVEETLGDA